MDPIEYDQLLHAAVRLALRRDQQELAACLLESSIDYLSTMDHDDYDWVSIYLACSPDTLDTLAPYAAETKNAETKVMDPSPLMVLFRDVYPKPDWVATVEVSARLTAVDGWREQVRALMDRGPTNQGRQYGDARRITHGGLGYRSNSEVAIAKVLEQSEDILFFPRLRALAGKVLKEPDFLILYKKRLGILEVDGPAHGGRAAHDSLRDGYFQRQGIFMKHYPSEKCQSDPVWVVRDFLKLLLAT